MLAAPKHASFLAACARGRASRQTTSRRKTRVGLFLRRSTGRTLATRSQVARIASGCAVLSSRTVSGRPDWLARDPIGENGGLNLYGYVGNNPIDRIDPLGLFTPVVVMPGVVINIPITFFPGPIAVSKIPIYGNWGGPDYSGGVRPSQNGGQNGSGAPYDSMDELFKKHDLAYGQYGITMDTPNSNCDSIQDPCQRQKCQAKRKADAALFLGLTNLPSDPSQWTDPAPFPNDAKAYRSGALATFPWPK